MHRQFNDLRANVALFEGLATGFGERGLEMNDTDSSPGESYSYRLGVANIGDPASDDFEVVVFSLWLFLCDSDERPRVVLTIGFYGKVRDEDPEIHIQHAGGSWSIVSKCHHSLNPPHARESALFKDLRSVLLIKRDEERALEKQQVQDVISTMVEFFTKTKAAADAAHSTT